MTFETLHPIYQAALSSPSPGFPDDFPPPPEQALSAGEFVSLLAREAAERDPRARHPFLRRLAAGHYRQPQLQEWIRQEYPAVMTRMRRHAALASCAADCDEFRALLAYVAVEADADPVGGTFFSLPQLWVKFGIALGLNREAITLAQPTAALRHWQESDLASARSGETIPISFLVSSLLDSPWHSILGSRLESQLGIPHHCLDYFWAIAANRWGEDTGAAILHSWSGTRERQRELWSRYAQERRQEQSWDRLTLLQTAVESGSAT